MMTLGSAPYVVTFSSGFLIEVLDYCFYAFRNLKIHPLSFSMLSFTEFLSLFLTASFRSFVGNFISANTGDCFYVILIFLAKTLLRVRNAFRLMMAHITRLHVCV